MGPGTLNLFYSTVLKRRASSFNTAKPDGTIRKLTDVSKLHSLGWHHKIEVAEGVKKLYEWYLSN